MRQRLPILRSGGELMILVSNWQRSALIVMMICVWVRSAGCKLALLAIKLVDHNITFDTSTWAHIIRSGELVYNQCVGRTEREDGLGAPPAGGYVLTGNFWTYSPAPRSLWPIRPRDTWWTDRYIGDHRRLALILYAPGSFYDQQVESDLASRRTVVAEQEFGQDLDVETTTTKDNVTVNALVNLFGPILPRARSVAVA